MLYNLLVVSERATPTRSDKQKGGDARMLQKVLVVLVSDAIAVRIALDWMQDVKKAASGCDTDDERPEG